MPKPKNTKLSVFKGREARLHFAILQTLSVNGPQTIYEVHKSVRAWRGLRSTRYEGVNRRMKALEASGYLKKRGSRKTQAGFEAAVYESTAKAYLAFLLESMTLDELVNRIDENVALELLAIVMRSINSCEVPFHCPPTGGS